LEINFSSFFSNENFKYGWKILCLFQVKYHLEAMHFPGEYIYNCCYCGRAYKGRNALSCHVSQLHANQNKETFSLEDA
jgi:hypothetical protein